MVDLSFDWDEENVSHLARHKVKPSEAVEFFSNDPEVRGHEVIDGEDRWTSVGTTNAMRVLIMVFTMRGNKIRPITGWDADSKTKARFFGGRET
jgi:uncharacterized DUF497 family protein